MFSTFSACGQEGNDADESYYYEPSPANLFDLSTSDELFVELEIRTLNFASTLMAMPGNISFFDNFFQEIEEEMRSRLIDEGIDFRLNIIDGTLGLIWPTMDGMLVNPNMHTEFEKMLASGDIDVFLVAGHPLDTFVEKGHLADIYELIYQDPTVTLYDFYTNVLELFEIDGKLAAIPAMFNIPMVAVNASLPPSIIDRFNNLDVATIQDLLEIYYDLKNNYNGFEHLSMIDNITPQHVILYELNNHVSDLTDSSDFSNFLNEAFPLLNSLHGFLSIPLREPHMKQLIADHFVFTIKNEGLQLAQALIEENNPLFVHFIPMATDPDTLMLLPEWSRPTFHNMTYAIADNENASLAWEFVQLMIYIHAYYDQHSQMGWYTLDTSIRRDWFNERTYAIFNDLFASPPTLIRIPESTMENLNFSARGDEYKEREAISHAVQRHMDYTNMPLAIPPFIANAVFETYMNDFVQGSITAEVAAERIFEQIYLWMQGDF